jgi:SAM-dependent methyltransferase
MSNYQSKVFDENYMYFSDSYLTSVRTIQECSLIEKLCSLQKGNSILDVGCGSGRISNELARRGYSVTGIDWNKNALDRARRDADEIAVDVQYKELDYHALDWQGHFDCVISWYTSFGYFDDDSNREILAKIYAATKNNGKFLMDHINRDLSLRNFQRNVVHQRDEGFMIDFVDFDPIKNSIIQNRKYLRNGEINGSVYKIRLFTYTEIADWMKIAGYKKIRGYGREGETFSLESKRMIVVATKGT